MLPPVTPKEVQLAESYRAHMWCLTSVLKLHCPKVVCLGFSHDLIDNPYSAKVLSCAFGAIRLIWLAKSLLLSCENGEELWIQLTICNKKTAGYVLVNKWLRGETRECKTTRQLVGRYQVLSLCFQHCHIRWVCILKICMCVD